MLTYVPFSHRRSAVKSLLATTVVMALRSSWFRVTLTLLLMGRFSVVSRLPQYLIVAIFVGAVRVTTRALEAAAEAMTEEEDGRLRCTQRTQRIQHDASCYD